MGAWPAADDASPAFWPACSLPRLDAKEVALCGKPLFVKYDFVSVGEQRML